LAIPKDTTKAARTTKIAKEEMDVSGGGSEPDRASGNLTAGGNV
jgi:hypothetical protein